MIALDPAARMRGPGDEAMTFFLRAVLVIGTLTYFAAQRQATSVIGAAGKPAHAGVDLASAWNTLPAPARDRLAREGAAELARRVTAVAPSQDTLADSDRRPAWRGREAR